MCESIRRSAEIVYVVYKGAFAGVQVIPDRLGTYCHVAVCHGSKCYSPRCAVARFRQMNNPDRVIGRKGRGDSRAHLTGRSPAGGEVRDIQCNALVLSRQRTDGQHPRNVDCGETGPAYELHRLFLALHRNRACSVPSWGVQGGVPVAVRCQLPLDGGCPGADDPCAVSREVERGVRRAVARRCHQDDPEVDSQLHGGLKVGGTGPQPREAHADDLGWQRIRGYAVYGSAGGPHDSVCNV